MDVSLPGVRPAGHGLGIDAEQRCNLSGGEQRFHFLLSCSHCGLLGDSSQNVLKRASALSMTPRPTTHQHGEDILAEHSSVPRVAPRREGRSTRHPATHDTPDPRNETGACTLGRVVCPRSRLPQRGVDDVSRRSTRTARDRTGGGGRAMGRGRAKAKQTKVARQLKYGGPTTDLERLQAELAGCRTLPSPTRMTTSSRTPTTTTPTPSTSRTTRTRTRQRPHGPLTPVALTAVPAPR